MALYAYYNTVVVVKLYNVCVVITQPHCTIQIDLGHGAGVDHLLMPMEHRHVHSPPTEDEQQQMAMFWAMEEVNTPRGWGDEAELDYMAVSQRQAQAEQTGGSPTSKASGKY